MAVFGIIHDAHSAAHTEITLASFLRHTSLRACDDVLLLDNEGNFPSDTPGVQVVRTGGGTFAQNANAILWRARSRHTAAFCLTSGLIFTAGWRDELDRVGAAIACPLRHHDVPDFRLEGQIVPPAFDLSFYHQHQEKFERFSGAARRGPTQRFDERVWLPSFECFRVAPEVIARLGPLDERFQDGAAGADYALRAQLGGVDCVLCHTSFVFHFTGNAVHRVDRGVAQAGEPRPDDARGHVDSASPPERDQATARAFESKWGPTLARRFLFTSLDRGRDVDAAAGIIRQCLAVDGRTPAEPICGIAELAPIRADDPRQLYLDLLKRSLTNAIYGDAGWLDHQRQAAFDPERRRVGRDWPTQAHTMIGARRLDNVQYCIGEVLRHGVPGDLIETGVWRGGATIFMRGVLKAYGVTDRRVWVADSFQGLPPPQANRYPQDVIPFHEWPQLAIPLEEVKSNFRKYDLLDGQVRFLKGWFRDTLPSAPIERLAVARLDGDMYESTMDGLLNLYDKLSPGGYLIVDDYGAVTACRQAVDDFRAERAIADEVHIVDWGGAFWRKS